MKLKLEKLHFFSAVAAAMLLLCCFSADAQTFSGMSDLDNIAAAGQQAGKRVVNIVFVISGIVAAIALAPAALKAFKGEPQSRDAIMNVGLGAVGVFVILAIIKVAMGF